MKRIAILGTVGIPAAYGGFETLVENLVNYKAETDIDSEITVFCSGRAEGRPENYNGAKLKYVNLSANGFSSIFYDIVSLIHAMRGRYDAVLLLGVSGALFLTVVRIFSNIRVITNVDGIEWKREKWGRLASLFLRFSEWSAVKFSHEVISDNQGIANYIKSAYGKNSHVIAYGGDHAIVDLDSKVSGKIPIDLPNEYCLALCRIEPENNVAMILKGFFETPNRNLVFIGNWDNSSYGRKMKESYGDLPNIYLVDPIYDLNALMSIRSNCAFYVHGHSAGGTNPSLVEMMHFGKSILAYDCLYNRATTNEKAIYFKTEYDLTELLSSDFPSRIDIATDMKKIAVEQYTWKKIGKQYFELLL